MILLCKAWSLLGELFFNFADSFLSSGIVRRVVLVCPLTTLHGFENITSRLLVFCAAGLLLWLARRGRTIRPFLRSQQVRTTMDCRFCRAFARLAHCPSRFCRCLLASIARVRHRRHSELQHWRLCRLSRCRVRLLAVVHLQHSGEFCSLRLPY